MIKIVIAKLAKRLCEERGQALIAVLVFLMIGSLSLSPLLSYISTALKTDRTYQSKTAELYAADSGIDDAIWQIKYDNLNTLFFEPPVYDIYDFDSVWSYSLSEPINDMTADVTIQNVWIPKDVTPLSPAEGRAMIESNKLMVTGTTTGETTYKIKINFTPDEGEEEDLYVDSIGIWLPLGFEYDTGSSNLEEDPDEPYYSVPTASDHAGGQAVIWDLSPSVAFTSFPGVTPGEMPLSTHITFNYTPSQPGTSPAATAWMETSGVSDVPLSWDIDTRIYKITSAAGNTEIEAYSAKCEIRKMGTAIAGDYKAVGNSLMTNEHWDWWEIRETKLDESSAEVSDIPSSAVAMAAYLYWSGWFKEGVTTDIFSDTCSNFDNWDRSGSSGSPTEVPTSDGDISGTWNTSPCWDDVDETTPNDSDYMTGTWDWGGYKLFNFSPFTIPPGATITDLTVYVRARRTSGWGTCEIRPSIKVNGTRYNTTATSNNPGSSFDTYSYSYTTNPSTGSAWTAEDLNGTGSHPLQQFGVYSSDLNPDVQVSMVYAQVTYGDSRWTINSNRFQGQGSGSATTEQRTLTLKNSLDLSSCTPGSVTVSWDQAENGYLDYSDTLYFAISSDGGNTWSSNMEVFHDDNPDSSFYYTIPDEYLTDNFKIRFYFNFDEANEYVYLDNIQVVETAYVPDTTCDFKINSHEEEITADEWEILENNPGEYSYACHTDVTPLVKTYSNLGDYENHTGNALYTVGGVDADEGIDGDPDYHWAYAGWSLIIIYSSPETAGHQLYLYDTFFWAPVSPNVDWDGDGEPGGDITGFYIPDPSEDIVEYPDAATLTCFVAEGDNWLSGDKLVFEGEALSDGFTSSNVWNSKSVGMSEDGMDIDTFHITWESGLLEPGDTTAQLDMPNPNENWNLIYIILSMRSETTTGGTVHYLLRNR